MASISLISVNVERDKHLESVLPFLKERHVDVVCLQEVREEDIKKFCEVVPGEYVFAPLMRHRSDDFKAVVGDCVISRSPILRKETQYYVGEQAPVPKELLPDKTHNHAVIVIEVGGESRFRIATTHFVWSPQGKPTDRQREAMQALLTVLKPYGELVLCGDFNAPRFSEGKPGEIYTILAGKYKDNIPSHYETSLDLSLHRVGKERAHELADKMVDYIFSTPSYTVSSVELMPGVSDHLAIVATISKED